MDLLSELISEIDWCEFEARADGTLHVKYRMGVPCAPVHMRVGTYLRKPMQVIMAVGEYIRMRAADKFANYGLKPLDPQHPESTLYPIEPYEQQLLGGGFRPLWQPIDPNYFLYQQALQTAQYTQASQLAQYQQQQAMQQAQAQYQSRVLTSNNTSWPLGSIW